MVDDGKRQPLSSQPAEDSSGLPRIEIDEAPLLHPDPVIRLADKQIDIFVAPDPLIVISQAVRTSRKYSAPSGGRVTWMECWRVAHGTGSAWTIMGFVTLLPPYTSASLLRIDS